MDLWVEKWRPTKLVDMVLDDVTKSILQSYIDKKSIPHLLFYGGPGKGKTTLAKLLVNELDALCLYINASEENGIDIIRNKIKDFVEAVSFDKKLKIVILDEADGLSSNLGNSSAQSALRNLIESSSDDTRFILTCNYLSKIIEPIQSRCSPFNIKFSQQDVLKRICFILKEENIDVQKYKTELAKIIRENFPDIRQIINVVERCCVSNNFSEASTTNSADINNIVDFIMTNIQDMRKCREFWIKNESLFSDYFSLAHCIFNRLIKDNELLFVGEQIFKMNQVLDKEIQFYCLVTGLKNLKNEKTSS